MKPDTQFVNLPLKDPSYEASLEKYFTKTWEFGPFKTFSSKVYGMEQKANDNKVSKDLLRRFQNHALEIDKIQDKKLLFGVCLACNMNELALAFANKSKMSSEEVVYLALRQNNDQFLSLFLEKGVALDPDWKPGRYERNWLVYATLSNIENLRLIFKCFDAETLKRLASQVNGGDSVLEIALSKKTKDLAETLTLFTSVGINFNVTDEEGKYPIQHYSMNQTDPERQAIFKQYNLVNTMSLEAAIAHRNIEAVKTSLKGINPASFTFIFKPTSDEKHKINQPFHLKHDEIIHGGYKWSPRISFFEYAIYCGDVETVKLLVDNILTPSFSSGRKLKILEDSIGYLQASTIKAKNNDPERVPKLEMIEKFLQGRFIEEEFKLSPKSILNFYQPAPLKADTHERPDYDDWKAPTYSA